MTLAAADHLAVKSVEGSIGTSAVAALKRVRAVVLLGGAPRPTSLSRAANRSVLDLPVDAKRTLMDLWLDRFGGLAQAVGLELCPVRVRLDPWSTAPQVREAPAGVHVQIETDGTMYRGTGGVLRDLAEDMQADDLLLVATAAQVLLEPLEHLAQELVGQEADVALLSHADGVPGGLMLLRCGVLKEISRTGFVDLKEQALPKIAKQHQVRVVERAAPVGMPVRTGPDYISALRRLHRITAHAHTAADPLAEDWWSTFSILEAGAAVAPGARIHDSVVLAGGRVAEGAVVVRSVVGPGASIPAGHTVIDQVIDGGTGKR